jgi:adenylyl-sulfate kinase
MNDMSEYTRLKLTAQGNSLTCSESSKGLVIWLTGLSGAGKSTLANALKKSLDDQRKNNVILDGDYLRMGLNQDLGFSDGDRKESIRRASEVAKLMADSGLIVIVALISPFADDRDMARKRIGDSRFIEVFVNTPLVVCEQRDPKGLYRSSRLGLHKNMTGIDSPYQPPLRPDCVVMGDQPLDESIQRILKCL